MQYFFLFCSTILKHSYKLLKVTKRLNYVTDSTALCTVGQREKCSTEKFEHKWSFDIQKLDTNGRKKPTKTWM